MTTLRVRLGTSLERRLEASAIAHARSLEEEVVHRLERSVDEPSAELSRPVRLLGRFEGGQVPSERDFRTVRAMWCGALRDRAHRLDD